ncbi:MAG: hypothetical protein GXO05_04565 [Aquificae bacterium]|nr:hypothetical protein [Aquificota bacterium]
MNSYLKKGVGFGLTSGVITTLSMLIGLSTISDSRAVVIGGILSIAIADAASDALGMHIAEESHEKTEEKHIWTATLSTFFSKFIFAMTFMVPVALFEIKTAVIISLIWGFLLLTVFSYKIALDRKENPVRAVVEHVVIATVVLTVIHLTGKLVKTFE